MLGGVSLDDAVGEVDLPPESFAVQQDGLQLSCRDTAPFQSSARPRRQQLIRGCGFYLRFKDPSLLAN